MDYETLRLQLLDGMESLVEEIIKPYEGVMLSEDDTCPHCGSRFDEISSPIVVYDWIENTTPWLPSGSGDFKSLCKCCECGEFYVIENCNY